MTLKDKMDRFSEARAASTSVEGWDTRHGKSVRVVKRTKGRFVSNVSAKQLATPI